jgi:hypothetical protein
MTITIIAARPGWYVAMFTPALTGHDGWPDHLSLRPIIAWEIERVAREQDFGRPGLPRVVHSIMPLTVEGNMDQFADWWAIKSPDGKYSTPEGICDDEAEAIDVLKTVYAECLRERAAQGRSEKPKEPAA